MPNAVIPFQPITSLPAAFAGLNIPDMVKAGQAGLTGGFPVLRYRGKVWSIRTRGEDIELSDGNGDPLQSLQVIIVGVAEQVSNQWYSRKWSAGGEGGPPDCYATDGLVPDDGVAMRQSATCKTCPHQVWGSRITEDGKKAKACQNFRRIAVVPYGDEENEIYGGPMMLTLSPMTMNSFAQYMNWFKIHSALPFLVVTKLSFDRNESYPLIQFEAIGSPDADSQTRIAAVMQHPNITRILNGEGGPAERMDDAADATDDGMRVQGEDVLRPVKAPTPAAAAPISERDDRETRKAAMRAEIERIEAEERAAAQAQREAAAQQMAAQQAAPPIDEEEAALEARLAAKRAAREAAAKQPEPAPVERVKVLTPEQREEKAAQPEPAPQQPAEPAPAATATPVHRPAGAAKTGAFGAPLTMAAKAPVQTATTKPPPVAPKVASLPAGMKMNLDRLIEDAGVA